MGMVPVLDRRGRRYARRDALSRRDPDMDYHEIYRQLATLEFPWDIYQALSFALFRTYAVPSIGGLLHRSGEFTARVQKRYDDTVLILDAVLEHGFDHPTGRAAIRRMNQMHGSYPISNDDLRYVLAAFVVVPVRWLRDYGWRQLTDLELRASVTYYQRRHRPMLIRAAPPCLGCPACLRPRVPLSARTPTRVTRILTSRWWRRWPAGYGRRPAHRCPLMQARSTSRDSSFGLYGVSCESAGACTAVGYHVDASGTGKPLVETLTGGVWTPTSPALPSDASVPSGAALVGVSCESAGTCVAIGQYFDTSFTLRPFVETRPG